jgi:hypothetical protein
MSFIQASPLSDRPRELLNQRNGARLFGAVVSVIISSFLLITLHTSFKLFHFAVAFRLPQPSNCSGRRGETLGIIRHASVNDNEEEARQAGRCGDTSSRDRHAGSTPKRHLLASQTYSLIGRKSEGRLTG